MHALSRRRRRKGGTADAGGKKGTGGGSTNTAITGDQQTLRSHGSPRKKVPGTGRGGGCEVPLFPFREDGEEEEIARRPIPPFPHDSVSLAPRSAVFPVRPRQQHSPRSGAANRRPRAPDCRLLLLFSIAASSHPHPYSNGQRDGRCERTTFFSLQRAALPLGGKA